MPCLSRLPFRDGQTRCDARAEDPLGILAQPFSVGGALRNGWRLFVGALSGIAVVSLIMARPFRVGFYVLSASGLRVSDSFRLSRLLVEPVKGLRAG